MKPIAKTVDLLDHLARNASFLVVDEIMTWSVFNVTTQQINKCSSDISECNVW
jgi:hypothetical protein